MSEEFNDRTACSFDNWYPQFKNDSIPAVVVDLPEDVLQYLKADGVVIPIEALVKKKPSSYVDDITFKDWDSDGELDDETPPPTFPEFSRNLREIVSKLGGSVFIKLNWSAPFDARWIATNSSLKCTNLQDIYLLLKGSDRIANDLEVDSKNGHKLVMKSWIDIHPGNEFRCFVKRKQLVAVTQRNNGTEFHQHIHNNKYEIIKEIKEFFNKKVKSKFTLDTYLFDVVWDSNKPLVIMDFGPFDKSCQTYLFSWRDINEMEYNEELSPEFRYICENPGIQPKPDLYCGIPAELSHMADDDTKASIIEMLQSHWKLQSQEE